MLSNVMTLQCNPVNVQKNPPSEFGTYRLWCTGGRTHRYPAPFIDRYFCFCLVSLHPLAIELMEKSGVWMIPCGGADTKARVSNHYTSTVRQSSQLDPTTRKILI